MHQTMETYLLGRDHVSIPQLQSDLDCNYPRAAEMLRCCIKQGWVSPRADARIIKFVLLEAFLSTWDFDAKEEYDARIWTVRRTLSGQFYCTPLLSRLINQVYRDIRLELTLENIRKIRHLINSE